MKARNAVLELRAETNLNNKKYTYQSFSEIGRNRLFGAERHTKFTDSPIINQKPQN
jgi:hypothetical protein